MNGRRTGEEEEEAFCGIQMKPPFSTVAPDSSNWLSGYASGQGDFFFLKCTDTHIRTHARTHTHFIYSRILTNGEPTSQAGEGKTMSCLRVVTLQ